MKREKPELRFLLCVHNEDAEDLEPRKVYPVLPDRAAEREGYVRVVDESGEDYLYPSEYFVPVKLPVAVAQEWMSPLNNRTHATRQTRTRG